MRRAIAAVFLMAAAVEGLACPFCGVVGRSLAERRDAAVVTAVAENDGDPGKDAAGLAIQSFRLHAKLHGSVDPPETATARIDSPVRGTAILFGEPEDALTGKPMRWTAIAANEALIGHVATAPATSDPAEARLRWFSARLEHPEPAIAEDAFTEFGLAPFESVLKVADALEPAKLRQWVAGRGIDDRRRGFYGLALGVVAASRSKPNERDEAVAVLQKAIVAPADDFRAGYDGLLAGLLVAEGPRGLDFIERAGLLRPDARPVDQRHLLAALRFAWESLDDSIPRQRIADATAKLLAAPVVAAEATVDLARYRAWDQARSVAALWDSLGGDDPLVRRAVAGYLVACPRPEAKDLLESIRSRDPDLLREAMKAATLPRSPP